MEMLDLKRVEMKKSQWMSQLSQSRHRAKADVRDSRKGKQKGREER